MINVSTELNEVALSLKNYVVGYHKATITLWSGVGLAERAMIAYTDLGYANSQPCLGLLSAEADFVDIGEAC